MYPLLFSLLFSLPHFCLPQIYSWRCKRFRERGRETEKQQDKGSRMFGSVKRGRSCGQASQSSPVYVCIRACVHAQAVNESSISKEADACRLPCEEDTYAPRGSSSQSSYLLLLAFSNTSKYVYLAEQLMRVRPKKIFFRHTERSIFTWALNITQTWLSDDRKWNPGAINGRRDGERIALTSVFCVYLFIQPSPLSHACLGHRCPATSPSRVRLTHLLAVKPVRSFSIDDIHPCLRISRSGSRKTILKSLNLSLSPYPFPLPFFPAFVSSSLNLGQFKPKF